MSNTYKPTTRFRPLPEVGKIPKNHFFISRIFWPRLEQFDHHLLSCLKCQQRADLILSGDGRWAQFLWEIENHSPPGIPEAEVKEFTSAEKEVLKMEKQEPRQESSEEAMKKFISKLEKT